MKKLRTFSNSHLFLLISSVYKMDFESLMEIWIKLTLFRVKQIFQKHKFILEFLDNVRCLYFQNETLKSITHIEMLNARKKT